MTLGPPVDEVVEVAVQDGTGSHAGCYRDRAGAVWCWGGSNVALNFVEPQPGPWRVPLAGQATRVIGWGEGHCAILADRSAWCWRGIDGAATPTRLPVTEVVDLAGGAHHLCVARADGTVWCSGANEVGQLGQPPGAGSATPVKVQAVRDAVRLVAGGQRTCAVSGAGDRGAGDGAGDRGAAGEITCWGYVATGTTYATPAELAAAVAPTRVPGLDRLALGYSGTWALDGEGRLATVTFTAPGAATVTPIPGVPKGATTLAAGGDWACAVSDGEVWCAGRGPSPRMVDDEARRRMERAAARAWRVDGIADAVGVSVYTVHACAVTASGGLSCWGSNTLGELGDGTVVSRWDHAAPVRTVVRDLVPAPPTGVFGCETEEATQRRCAALGVACRLVPPPGYWATPPSGVDHTGDEAYQEMVRQMLAERPVPDCMCTCDAAYAQMLDALQRRLDREGPLP